MVTDNKLVSIIIPVYNSEKFLFEALQSVAAQTYKSWEAIIVDDCSVDGTVGIAKNFAGRDSRFKVLELREHSLGVPAIPRNYGLKQASGRYVAFLDSDDVWAENKLEIQVAFLEKHSTINIVYGLTRSCINNRLIVPPCIWVSGYILSYLNPIVISAILLRRAVVLDEGGFNEEHKTRGLEDIELWRRLVQRGHEFSLIRKTVCFYRRREVSVSSSIDFRDRSNRAMHAPAPLQVRILWFLGKSYIIIDIILFRFFKVMQNLAKRIYTKRKFCF